MKNPKILLYDIETTPLLSYTWVRHDTDVIKVIKESEMLSFSYKYLGDKDVKCLTRADFKDKTDKSLCKALHKLLDDADIVIAHNGIDFDNKKSFARFIFHDLPSIPKLCSVDTKRVAKNGFAFSSNSLDNLGEYLGVGRKMKHSGFELWERCMAGEKKAFKEMAEYNKQDVALLERVYKRLRPWMHNHPSMAILRGFTRDQACPDCGSQNVESRGKGRAAISTVKEQYRCKDCGGWFLVAYKKPKKGKNK